jgi:hypothetical protein
MALHPVRTTSSCSSSASRTEGPLASLSIARRRKPPAGGPVETVELMAPA